MNVHAAIRQLATNTPFHWNLNFNWRLPTIEILHVTYIECTLAQTLLCEISELTNEIHQHDCRSSVLRPCQRYIVHTEADRPAENVVVATGSSSYVDHAANLYIHSDSWLLTHERVIHRKSEDQLRRCYSGFYGAYTQGKNLWNSQVTWNKWQPKTRN